LRPLGVTAGLAAVAAGGWIAVIELRRAAMGGGGAMGSTMAMGPGSVDAAAFLGVWVAMVAAMMLPTIQPMVLTYRSLFRGDGPQIRWSRMAAFLAPYALL
jgi:predicted metal-binding membrane protein